ncbi:Retrovirus-related Pol polyprotein, partial [Mucuna pruriens]
MANALATLASMFEMDRESDIVILRIRHQSVPAYCQVLEKEIDGKLWYHDIKQYLKNKEYLAGATENNKRTLRRMVGGYLLNGEVLYKRSSDMTLLWCVDEKEANEILEEIHEGVFGTHASVPNMARKILRVGYYWVKMEVDCCEHVRRCHKFQIYVDNIKTPTTPLNPKASNGHRFILVAIDYFTKWVEAASYPNVTKNVVVKFVKRDLICRYGVPSRIITDNGTNLNNKMMIVLCEQFKIHHHRSTPYRPKENGAVEAANKNIKKIIQKMVVTYRDWHEMLSFALHGYRTTVHISTGATPYSLVYGAEAILPIEVEIPSLWVLMEAELEEAEWMEIQYDQLNLIEGKRLAMLCQG